ncbi:arylamine N-acetyltransferase [Caballeronia sp. SEWSISQ10-4 2]|uniref:arylamine N-acetyltransferase family protein n=1 Tax=Caballeronia sp. SEWSISQ10-4 2 TaxID=2937438 RepID=UPI00264C57BF|nr:arylamine N-acetyltransferase [Caballeronia sp. SEWSISQ10-4 2]MDN7181744.1 arylamine N-acetyltransferase [Caballeronia sp. SEWSISQ10-4 2]
MNQTLSPAQLAAYFDRIGYITPDRGPHQATSDTLHALHRLHPQVIPFENLDALLGRTPRLDLESVFAKLVTARRGGYCYEHNLLFRAVLNTLGFETTGLAARVVWSDPVAMPPRTHMMLLVETPDETWLADVGFGSMTLSAPLLFDTGREQATPHETFRIDLIERGDFLLQVKLGDAWKPIYRFDLEPQFPADYAMANHYVSTFPESIFLNRLIVARVMPGERRTLFDTTLTRRGDTAGFEAKRELTTAAELRGVLQDVFGLALTDNETSTATSTPAGGLDTMLDRIVRSSVSTPS